MAIYDIPVTLTDGVSGPAKSAAAGVRGVAAQMSEAQKQATVLQKALNKTSDAMLIAKAKGDDKTFWKLAGASNGFKKELEGLQPALAKQASAHAASTAAAELAAKKQAILNRMTQQQALVSKALSADAGKAATSVAKVGTATQGASAEAAGLQGELAAMTGGLSVVVESAAAVGLAFGAVVVAGAAMAIEAVELKEKMTTLFDALGEGKISGKQTIAMLDDLGDSIGQTRKQLAPFAQSFMTMGVTGVDQLRELTLAAASAGILAVGGGEAFTKMFKKINAATATGQALKIPLKGLGSLADMGLDVDDVAKKMGISAKSLGAQLKSGSVNAKQFGDALKSSLIDKGALPLQKAGAALSNVWGKFQENITKMFEDVDVGPFLEQVRSLFDIFGNGKASGQALKSGIGAFFSQVFVSATKLVPMVKHFLLDMVIYGLKAYIALKPIVKTVKDFINSATGAAVLGPMLDIVIGAFKAIAVVIGTIIVVGAVLVGAIIAMNVAIVAVGYAILNFVSQAGMALTGWVAGAATAAYDFVAGLVKGITGGAGMVVDAVKGLAGGAVNAFEGALGIHSPSRVMMELGGHTGAGFAQGLDDTVGDVHASASTISSAAFSGASSAGAAPVASAASSGGPVTFAAGSIVIDGAGKSAFEITEEMIGLAFEKMALGSGV